MGVGWLHLQLAERLPSARRDGKFRAQANSVNSGCADNQQRNLFAAAILNGSGLDCANFFQHTVSVFAPTGVLIFPVKKIFLSKSKIKFIFFL
jgi:hypothetical protein